MKLKSGQDAEELRVLLSHATKLRTELESSDEPIAYRSSLITILSDLERELSGRSVDVKKLGQAAFGIFRLVTESSQLENSQLGKDLLTLHHQIRSLTSG